MPHVAAVSTAGMAVACAIQVLPAGEHPILRGQVGRWNLMPFRRYDQAGRDRSFFYLREACYYKPKVRIGSAGSAGRPFSGKTGLFLNRVS